MIYDHSEHCPLGEDKLNTMIGVQFCYFAVACSELAHILQSDICSDVLSPSFHDALSCAD